MRLLLTVVGQLRAGTPTGVVRGVRLQAGVGRRGARCSSEGGYEGWLMRKLLSNMKTMR